MFKMTSAVKLLAVNLLGGLIAAESETLHGQTSLSTTYTHKKKKWLPCWHVTENGDGSPHSAEVEATSIFGSFGLLARKTRRRGLHTHW